mmetsp:Transcript_20605/g.53255  ORF Transcript_20605/g.53255 Transcript_20605/m.53255 type:complete len:308 (+) Transcript_20605:259-1182(+)
MGWATAPHPRIVLGARHQKSHRAPYGNGQQGVRCSLRLHTVCAPQPRLAMVPSSACMPVHLTVVSSLVRPVRVHCASPHHRQLRTAGQHLHLPQAGSAAAALLDRLGLAGDCDLGLAAIVHRGLARHPRFDLRGHLHEGVLHIRRVLRAGLKERDTHGVRELVGCLRLHLALARQVALVADEQLVDVLRCIPVNLVQPGLDVLERLRVGDVIHDDDAVRAAVIAARDRAEALLPRRIPDLQLDGLAIELNRANFEVHADRADVRLRVRVVSEAQQQARLAHATVANQHQLEDVVILLRHGRGKAAAS